jgi:hypothetical protein
VTGAPKIAAMDLIAELEPVGRGASMGALGALGRVGLGSGTKATPLLEAIGATDRLEDAT